MKILNSVRIGRVTDDIVDILKETAKQKIESNGVLATRLCSHVKEADEINEFQLDELKGESKVYTALIYACILNQSLILDATHIVFKIHFYFIVYISYILVLV